MIENVSWERTTFRPAPERFEAGTPNIAGAIGFGAAIDYMAKIDKQAAHAHEAEVTGSIPVSSSVEEVRISVKFSLFLQYRKMLVT